MKSQSAKGKYDIYQTKIGWTCSCPDHKFRGIKCKHIFAVEFSYAIRETVREEVIIRPVSQLACRSCNSERIVKKAIRRNKLYDIPRYLCKDCGKRFSFNMGFEKMRAPPDAITSAMQLYFTGESFRNVMRFLKLPGVDVSHVAVYKWIRNYVTLMQSYVEKIKLPSLGNAWRTDELYVKVKGDMKYMYALMDYETRFWIAQQVSGTKYNADIQHQAFKEEFATLKSPKSRHIRHIRLQGDHNSNKMERLNGEVRDREKVMRGLKKMNTPILTGYQLFHNYMRPHEALKGKTPSEKCGIEIDHENKWITLIQNASKDKKS